MRVLLLPTSVGAMSSGLSRQLRRLGIDTEVWTIEQDYLEYPVDRVVLAPGASPLRQLWRVLRAGTYVFGRWDVVHYNYGSTLYSNGGKLLDRGGGPDTGVRRLLGRLLDGVAMLAQRGELLVLRLRRIPYFVHYLGDDARQGDYTLAHHEIGLATQVPPGYYTPESDAWKRRQIVRMTRRAAGVYAVNPDLLDVLPPSAAFVPYGHVDVAAVEPAYTQAEHERLVFAHAPSHRAVKGTDAFLAALEALRAEGHDFELDLIEGVSNAEALERYRQADVLLDQLHAGWYGGVAVETMALGKPVVAYIRDADLRHLPPEMTAELPLIRATSASVQDVLSGILETPRDELVALAARSRRYVERWHDPVAIATRIAADYRRALGTEGSP